MVKLTAKAREYVAAGTRIVWIVDPRSRRVAVHAPGRQVVTLAGDDTIDGGDVLPGFTLPLPRLFAVLD